jgi:gluconate 2-dehydrogenase alpha chain
MAVANEKAQVCLIGLGAVGGIMAQVLTEAGLHVLALEAGPFRTNSDFPMDELRAGFGGRNEMGAKYMDELPTWRLNANTPTQPYSPYQFTTMMNGAGGSSVHWCAALWRFHLDDFYERTSTIKRYGGSYIPSGTDLVDWPLRYEDLESYYDKVEYLFGVSGKAGNLRGQKVEGGNPFEAPRQRDYPNPPLREMPFGELMRGAATRLGLHPFPAPAAINSQPYDGRPACTYCGFCCGFGCHVGAKASTLVTAIPRALRTGRLEVRSHARVMRLIEDGKKVTSVEYVDLDGKRHVAEAAIFVLGSYCIENNRLLMLSTSPRFPNGLGNTSGMLGKYYMSHQTSGAVLFLAEKDLNRWAGPTGQSISLDDYGADNFDHTGLGFIRGGRISAGNQLTPIGGSRVVPPDVPRWGRAYKQYLNQNFNKIGILTSGGGWEIMPYEANFLDLDPVRRDRMGLPVIRITLDIYDNEKRALAFMQDKLEKLAREMGATRVWRTPIFPMPLSSHEYGGARMGEDPKRSLVNSYGRSWDLPNLFVGGGATWPTSPSFNPTGTIMAMSWRTADYIAHEWRRGMGM